MTFEVDEGAVLFTGETRPLPSSGDLEASLVSAFERPAGTAPLGELARGAKDILFLVEDGTRDTPLKQILPLTAAYLNKNGVGDGRISIMIAPGTHRPMTKSEILDKLGPEIVSRFTVRQHDAADRAAIEDLGTVREQGYDVPVRVSRRVLRADMLLGFGNIIPHCNAGFSGGGKIVIPGVGDFASTSAVHAAAAFHPRIPLGENDPNPCRRAIEAGAKKVGLDFILNVVLGDKGAVAGVFAGDFIKAHRAGSALAAEAFKVEAPERADIVAAGSYPADADFWQAGKALAAASMAVKEGGIIILAAPCPEGLAHNHPRYREYLRLSLADNLAVIRGADPGDEAADVVAASVAAENCKIKNQAEVFIVTEGLSKSDLDALGFTAFDSVESAVKAAISLKPGAGIGVLPRGGHALPAVKG